MRKPFSQIGRSVLATAVLLVMAVSAFTSNASILSAHFMAWEEQDFEFTITLNSPEISHQTGSSGGNIPNDPTLKSFISSISLRTFLSINMLLDSVSDEYCLGSHKLSSAPPFYILFHSLKVNTPTA